MLSCKVYGGLNNRPLDISPVYQLLLGIEHQIALHENAWSWRPQLWQYILCTHKADQSTSSAACQQIHKDIAVYQLLLVIESNIALHERHLDWWNQFGRTSFICKHFANYGY